MFEINVCSPLHNQASGSQFDFHIIRLLFITVLLLLYVMYLGIRLIFAKMIKNLEEEDDNGGKVEEKKHMLCKWERQYSYVIGDHAIAIGFVICFSPYIFQMILSGLYLLLRIFYEVRFHKFNVKQSYIKTILRIINLLLFICAMVGLSRTEYNIELQNCEDKDYRF